MVGARVDAVHGRHVLRARQVVDDGVEQRLHARFLNAEPSSTGVTAIFSVAARRARLIISGVTDSSSRR